MAEEHKKLRAVLEGNAEFSKKLYAVFSRSPGNVFFSPLSIHSILSLMYQAARGRTKEAFSKTLNVSDEEIAALGYKDVMTRLNNAEGVTLHIANKIFVQETYGLQDSFKSVAQDQFLSEVDLLNFKEASVAVKSINAWVENKTNNKIRDVFNPDGITADTVLVLVNAIYFKGMWMRPFNPTRSFDMKFYLNDEDTVLAKAMSSADQYFNYKKDPELNAQVLELPYRNKNFNMVVILPNARNGVADLEERLASTDLTKITENMSSRRLQVSLPKFRIEKSIDLQDALTQLDLGVLFTEDAELSGLIKTSQPLPVGKVVQKTFIDVNELGTEAAACSGWAIPLCRSLAERFFADHPFVIILADYHENTKTILFQGRISNPSASEM